MTTTDAARLARCTIGNIQAAIKRGNLLAVKIGRDWQIDPKDFEQWMSEARKVGRKTLWRTFSIKSADDFRRLQSSLSGLHAYHNPKFTVTMAGGHICEIETNLPLAEIRVWFRASDVRMPDCVTDIMPLDDRVAIWESEGISA